jgi:hypothetical protein
MLAHGLWIEEEMVEIGHTFHTGKTWS